MDLKRIVIAEAFTLSKDHNGGTRLSHTTATLYPNCDPVYDAAFADVLNKQVRGRPSLLALLGVNKQVWPATVTTQNVDVTGSTANVPCGYGQFAGAKAVADLVAEGVITKEIGNQLAGIVLQQFHHWALTEADAEFVLNDQYHGAKNAVKKALEGGGTMEATIENIAHVHELVSSEVFGKIDPKRITAILGGDCKVIDLTPAATA